MPNDTQSELLFYKSIVDTVHEPLLVLDSKLHIIFASRSFYSTFFVAPSEIVNISIYSIGNGAWDNVQLKELFDELLLNKKYFKNIEIEKNFEHLGPRVMSINAQEIYSPGHSDITILLAIKDITTQNHYEKKLQSLAMTEPLTGLLNRNSFYENLNAAINLSKRLNITISIISLDLDNFKPVNDKFGHHIGDLLLKEVALTLKTHTRDIDHIARLGGDEFIIVAISSTSTNEVEKLMNRIINEISEQRFIQDKLIDIGVSAGISLCPNDSTDPKNLMIMSDIALNRAKQEGKNRFVYFDKDIDLYAPII